MRFFPAALSLILSGFALLATASVLAEPHPYELNLHSGNEELKQVLVSNLNTQREQILAQNQGISRARLTDYDDDVLLKVLYAQGYYEASVVLEAGSGPKADENVLTYHVVEGPQYQIGSIEFKVPPWLQQDFSFDFGVAPGEPLLATTVLAAKERLQKRLENACLLEIDLRHKVLLSRTKKNGDVQFSLKKTQKAKIQEIEFSGLETVDETHLRNRIEMNDSGCFDRGKVEQIRLDLLKTNLLARVETSIQVQEHDEQPEDGFAPVTITFMVEERKHRTIKFGLGYSTDEGGGVRGAWEHRNLFGSGEHLEIEAGTNEVKQYLNGEYRIQDFLRRKQNLTLTTELKNETTDAFESSRAKSSAFISRNLRKNILGELGVGLSHSEVIEDGETKRFNLLSFPMRLGIEQRNNVLDPTSGWHATTTLTPFTDLGKEDVRFLQWTVNSSAYFSANVTLRPTLAVRVSVGASTGTSLENIPADERFYVGGGGSVRGYAYQTVGNLTDEEADGGKSFAETSAELRFRIGKNWGLAVFCDGGYAYAEELPEFGTNFLWGAGLGLRYYTSFAPIRFDIATPLNRRAGIDDSVQFYVSIGQSF